MKLMAALSEKVVYLVASPSLLFSQREGVDLESMSALELVAEMDARGWVRQSLDEPPLHDTGARQKPKLRDAPPYVVEQDAPKVWYGKATEQPFKEYILSLLSAGAKGLPV